MKYRLLDLFCGAGGAAMGYHRAGFEVVGVVGHVKNYGVDQDSRVETYVPYLQSPIRFFTIVARGDGDVGVLAEGIRRAVQRADPNVPVFEVRRLTDILGEQRASRRIAALLTGVFAALALTLAAVLVLKGGSHDEPNHESARAEEFVVRASHHEGVRGARHPVHARDPMQLRSQARIHLFQIAQRLHRARRSPPASWSHHTRKRSGRRPEEMKPTRDIGAEQPFSADL